jgi:hypothetical protein
VWYPAADRARGERGALALTSRINYMVNSLGKVKRRPNPSFLDAEDFIRKAT